MLPKAVFIDGPPAAYPYAPTGAGVFRRLGAFLCDIVIYLGALELFYQLLVITGHPEEFLSTHGWIWGLPIYIFVTVLFWDDTPGCMFMELSTMRQDYAPLSIGRASARTALFLLTLPLCAVNLILIPLSAKRLTLHDRLTKTWLTLSPKAGPRRLIVTAVCASLAGVWVALRGLLALSQQAQLRTSLARQEVQAGVPNPLPGIPVLFGRGYGKE